MKECVFNSQNGPDLGSQGEKKEFGWSENFCNVKLGDSHCVALCYHFHHRVFFNCMLK